MARAVKITTHTPRSIGDRRRVAGMPTRGSFSSDLEYLLHLERLRGYIDQQFRESAKRFTSNLSKSRFTGA